MNHATDRCSNANKNKTQHSCTHSARGRVQLPLSASFAQVSWEQQAMLMQGFLRFLRDRGRGRGGDGPVDRPSAGQSGRHLHELAVLNGLLLPWRLHHDGPPLLCSPCLISPPLLYCLCHSSSPPLIPPLPSPLSLSPLPFPSPPPLASSPPSSSPFSPFLLSSPPMPFINN